MREDKQGIKGEIKLPATAFEYELGIVICCYGYESLGELKNGGLNSSSMKPFYSHFTDDRRLYRDRLFFL